MITIRYIFLILLSSISLCIFAQIESGLLFQSSQVNKDQRTSLHLTPDDAFEFSTNFTIKFDLKLQDKPVRFGYVFRIIFDNNQNFDLLLNLPIVSTARLLLIADNKSYCTIPIENSHFKRKDWNTISLEFDNTKKEFTFILNNEVITSKYKFPEQKKVDVCFGVNKRAPFITSDVPTVIIKNININIDNKRKEYLWELNKHSHNVVYDKFNSKKAITSNPVWMIDKHIKWLNNKELRFPSRIFAVFDNDSMLFLISENKVYSYNLSGYVLNEYPFEPALPITKLSNQFIYDSKRKQIVYVDFDSSNPVISHFDFTTKKWDIPISHTIESKYQQHNNFYSPVDSSLFQIFGYGFFIYNSDIKQIKKDGSYYSKSFTPNIAPRYLSATGIADSTLYIYGGVGNQSGKQELGAQIFNDLYAVDLRTFQVVKRWERNSNEHNEVAARTLIINKSENKAYSLFYNPTRYSSFLLLNEIDLKQPNTRILADTIPYFFQDTQSEALLHFNESAQKMYAVTIHKSESSDYILNTYEISYPILSADEVFQTGNSKNRWWYLASGILLTALISLYFIIRKKRKTSFDPIPVKSNKIENNPIDLLKTSEKEIKRPGIYLLGGFQVIDRDNHDKTGEFTPAMKVLLSLIILYSQKNGMGISNVKLKEILWFDKTDESARNNRSVNISKIRMILSTIGNVVITNENSYWYIDYKEDVFCDYPEALALVKSIGNSGEISVDNLMSLLNIISAGELLPDIQEDWMDNFKSDYSNLVIDILLSIKDNVKFKEELKLQILIADTVLVLDTLNEDAIKLKCKALIKMGRLKIAMDVFNSFCREYKTLLNEEFSSSFESFMKN